MSYNLREPSFGQGLFVKKKVNMNGGVKTMDDNALRSDYYDNQICDIKTRDYSYISVNVKVFTLRFQLNAKEIPVCNSWQRYQGCVLSCMGCVPQLMTEFEEYFSIWSTLLNVAVSISGGML